MKASYRLLDFGDGRRLERWGAWVIDRPALMATAPPSRPVERWEWDARYGLDGRWERRGGSMPERWRVEMEGLRLECRLGAGGQLGVFPEQTPLWMMLPSYLEEGRNPIRVLNLFGHSGAIAIAAARLPGVHPTLLDASPTALEWARANAALNHLPEEAIRRIEDDALAFVEREARRRSHYEAVILDPPSFGRAEKGRRLWKLDRDLPALLEGVTSILSPSARLVMLSAHTSGWDPHRLEATLRHALGTRKGHWISAPLGVATETGRALPLGAFAIWRA